MIKKLKLPPLVRHFENRKEIILRDYLALERTRLSNWRNFLAYITTSLHLIIGAIALFEVEGLARIKYLGYFAIALSVIIMVFGTLNFVALRKKLKDFYKTPLTDLS
ncbi:MAG TPA: DUF202 domain-containing protein [Flavobacterium sp.]|nr:DUF202 domain-containing protein [Flavobacterium sp.]